MPRPPRVTRKPPKTLRVGDYTLTVRSITEAGRLRSEFDIKFRWELFKDFFWEMDYYNSQDSQPTSGANATSDYGVITSLGWSF